MKNDVDVHQVENAIQAVLSKDFSGVKILRVHVEDDVDFDGDDILRVEVVFQGKPKDIQPNFVTKAIRLVRPQLSAMDVFAFPMMSFISEKDAIPARS